MKNKPHKRLRRTKRLLLFVVVIFVAIGFFGAGSAILWAMSLELPDFEAFEERLIAQSTKIYDRTGEVVLFDLNRDVRRTMISSDEMSRHIKNATVAIEDAEFYEHKGIKPTAILRAVFANILEGRKAQGGSTITQQLVKNTLLTNEKLFSRKLKEAAIAIRLERRFSKNEILELYLNEAPYGGNIYGIEEASQSFFGKRAEDVTLAEAAYLAALPNAPTYYSPYGENVNELENRKNTVLARMLEIGFIGEGEKEAALQEEVRFVPRENRSIKAPHFVMYVRSLLESEFGIERLETAGLKVVTTLDWDLQQMAEEIVGRIGGENVDKFGASNASLVATDPKSGDILVMVGSRDYWNDEIEGKFNSALSYRQPGSSFKPFVYATAFEKGYTPETVVFDLRTEFSTTCTAAGQPRAGNDVSTCYNPVNYDDVFRGPISLRNALAQSINIPAIKVLYLAGLTDSIQTARDMGIRGLEDVGRYGLTLVLGGGEVSLLDMTNAYATFASEGVRRDTTPILAVEDRVGNIVYEPPRTERRVLLAQAARQISDILSDDVARTPSYGPNSPLQIAGRDVAVKTGTTNDYRDAWIVGYAPNLAVGVWSGNNDNTSMEKRVAGLIVSPMWSEFVSKALATLPLERFVEPAPSPTDVKPVLRGVWQGGREYLIDTATGKLATEHTPAELQESRPIYDVHNILHWISRADPMGPPPLDPTQDSQYQLWEAPVQEWLLKQPSLVTENATIPTDYDDVHRPENRPVVAITSPTTGIQHNKEDRVTITVHASGAFPVTQVDYFLGGTYLGTTTQPPHTFSFTPNSIADIKTTNILRVVAYDTVRNRGEATQPFTVK